MRLEQKRSSRHEQRAAHVQQQKGAKPGERGADSKRRARKRALRQRREAALRLPRPLRCHVRAPGAGRRGWLAALGGTSLRDLTVAGILGMLAEIVWQETGGVGAWVLPVVALSTIVAVLLVARLAQRLWRAARTKLPAELSVLAEEVQIAWEGGAALSIPLDAIAKAEVLSHLVLTAEDVAAALRRADATVVITRRDEAPVHVDTTAVRAGQLAAAIEVARGDLAGRRASRPKQRPPEKKQDTGRASTPAEAAPPPPNEAALAALDRDGRPLGAWKQALRAAFTDAGYRRAPPLPPDELLQIVGDTRVSAERRVGAALALSERADDDLRARLRIASDGLETEALRVAVERAAEGTLEEDALEEALAHEEARR